MWQYRIVKVMNNQYRIQTRYYKAEDDKTDWDFISGFYPFKEDAISTIKYYNQTLKEKNNIIEVYNEEGIEIEGNNPVV